MHAQSTGFAEANGIKLYYEIYGSGAPLVLIHGGGSSGAFDFSEVIPRLAGQYTLITVDLQNHGRSDHRYEPATFVQDARDIIAVMDRLEIGKASFFGFSNGASTVMQIGHLFPQRCEKIIAASGLSKREGMIDGFFEGMQQATLDHMPAYLQENFLKCTPDPVRLQNMFFRDSQRMIHFSDWPDEVLQSINVPALFISGDRDVIKPEHTTAMSRLAPHSRLLILPAGHGAYMMPDELGRTDHTLIDCCVEFITRFLQT
jgi:pimeloyl-ACP methyl ester carboxylesterase